MSNRPTTEEATQKKMENNQQIAEVRQTEISSDKRKEYIFTVGLKGSVMALTDESKLDIRNPFNK